MTGRCAQRAGHSVPSPFTPEACLRADVGEGGGADQKGEDGRTIAVGAPLTPNPSPRHGEAMLRMDGGGEAMLRMDGGGEPTRARLTAHRRSSGKNLNTDFSGLGAAWPSPQMEASPMTCARSANSWLSQVPPLISLTAFSVPLRHG